MLSFSEVKRKKSAEEITLADHLRLISPHGGKARSAAMTDQERKAFARSGGLAGGKARATVLSKKRRQQIAKKAAEARWARRKQE